MTEDDKKVEELLKIFSDTTQICRIKVFLL